MKRRPRVPERYGYPLAAVCVALATALLYPGRAHLAKFEWALVYLLIVGLTAIGSGDRPALLAAALSLFTWKRFFLTPSPPFGAADVWDWVFLFVFLLVGMIFGLYRRRLKDRQAQMVVEPEIVLLHRFTGYLVSGARAERVVRRLVEEVRQITGASRVALLLRSDAPCATKMIVSPTENGGIPANATAAIMWVNQHAKAVGLPVPPFPASGDDPKWPATVSHREAGAQGQNMAMLLPVQTSTRPLGVLYVGEREDGAMHRFYEARTVVALASLVAAFLERLALQPRPAQAEAEGPRQPAKVG